jgi:hypothetical protein
MIKIRWGAHQVVGKRHRIRQVPGEAVSNRAEGTPRNLKLNFESTVGLDEPMRHVVSTPVMHAL